MASEIQVEVCFITPDHQFLRKLIVPVGTTLRDAIVKSELAKEFPYIDFDQLKTGIYSKLKTPDTVLREFDRVEIYRPLTVDPMIARHRRAQKKSTQD